MRTPVIPLTGTEAMRQLHASMVEDAEIHTTNDQYRQFLNNVYMGPVVWHGDVADEAAMRALNDTSSRGCWPGDKCKRADTGTKWECITNHGAALGDWVEYAAGASADALAWTTDEVVTVSAAVAGVTLPSSGVLDVTREYRVEFHGWGLTGNGDMILQVDTGGGVITSSTYERAANYHAAGATVATSSVGASGSSFVLLTAGSRAAATARGAVQFAPGDQATTKCIFDVESQYLNTSDLTTSFRGFGALSTPISAAIQAVQFSNPSNNTTAGVFILRSRPLTP